jgi:hypothetical protein
VGQEERRDRVAGAVDGDVEARGAHPVVPAALGGQQVDRVVGGVVGDRQQVELEVVGRDDVGGRDGDVAQELLDAGAHEHAAADVADHRVAAVDGVGVRRPHLLHGLHDRVADVRGPEVAREDGVAAAEHATVGDALDDLLDGLPVEDPSGPLAVAGVVGELHGVHRPDLDAEALQREDG